MSTARPNAPQGPSAASGARKYPTPPNIPGPALQALIPRLTTTINEIDAFNTILAQGQVDGSLPSWDAILQRYATLLGRINSVSSYLSLPPPAPPLRPNVPPPDPAAKRPALERVIIHPLNPLPDPSVTSIKYGNDGVAGGGQGGPNGDAHAASGPDHPANTDNSAPHGALHPIAHEAFFQVINTQPLPALSAAQADLVSLASKRAGWEVSDEQTLRRLHAGMEVPGIPASAQGGGVVVVQQLRDKLYERLKREEQAARRLGEVVREKEDEYDWGMRIDEEGPEQENASPAAQGAQGSNADDDEDLFGDDDDPKPIDPPAAALASGSGLGSGVPASGRAGGSAVVPVQAKNPREGWSTADYFRYMDTGRLPTGA